MITVVPPAKYTKVQVDFGRRPYDKTVGAILGHGARNYHTV
ncbi:MAG: hypothetical protein PHR77_10805 [Kiritimatiellae bacterium]|nr:hypothetical protein [Kiritimatiellia bacterium]MDD5522132.1 hypothetical protein [Kiritimatiellia bacterium]